MREYRVISADSHLEVPVDKWTHRVPERFRDRAPKRIKMPHGGDGFLVEGRLSYGGTGHYAGHTPEDFHPLALDYDHAVGSGPPEQRLREMDRDGVDAEIMYPGGGGGQSLRNIRDRESYLTILRAYNDWLAEEYCSAAPDRLFGVGILPNVGADEDIAELEHCAKIGLKAVVMYTFPSGKTYPLPEDDKFWAAAVDIPVGLTVHTSMIRRQGERGEFMLKYAKNPEGDLRPPVDLVDRMSRYGTRHCGCLEAVQMVMDGVFDRHPKLKIYWAENNIGWIPIYLEQMDMNYEVNHHWAERLMGLKPLKRKPSEYIREHAYWGFFDDPIGVKLRNEVGVDHIMWGSDFPHEVSRWPNSLEVMDKQFAAAGVTADEKQRMLAQNAIDFFHIDGQAV